MLRVIVKVGQAHFKQKPWSLVRDFTGGGEGGGEEEEQVLAVKDDYVGVTSIDAQATRTGPGPEGPGTRPKAKPGSKVGGSGEGNGETTFLDSRPGKTHVGPKSNSKPLLRRCCYSHFAPFARKSRFGGFERKRRRKRRIWRRCV